MNIYAIEGHKVKFVNPSAGYKGDQEHAQKYLTVDEVYTVKHTMVSSWSTSVEFKEFPNSYFNSVLFEDVESQSEEQDKQHLDYNRYNR